MLFLTRRYYVFDEAHQLLDGGVIRYNPTLEKIFIRNEDLRGEVFLSQEEEYLHMHGNVISKLAGKIHIDNILHPYHHPLKAPLSRVAKVENYLTPADIYEILQQSEQPDETFLKRFESSFHRFNADQARLLYIKIAPWYFENFDSQILKRITLFFTMGELTDKLYEELFMFLMAIQVPYEEGKISNYDLSYFLSAIEERRFNGL